VKIKKSIAFDIYELSEEVIHKMKKYVPDCEESVDQSKVIDAIFHWLDHYYLQMKLRWAQNIPSSVYVWREGLGIPLSERDETPVNVRVSNYLEAEMNEMLADILPNRTWHVVFIKRLSQTTFVLEIGEDYRILWYMDNVHKKSKVK
jgi:hypothetical protein